MPDYLKIDLSHKYIRNLPLIQFEISLILNRMSIFVFWCRITMFGLYMIFLQAILKYTRGRYWYEQAIDLQRVLSYRVLRAGLSYLLLSVWDSPAVVVLVRRFDMAHSSSCWCTTRNHLNLSIVKCLHYQQLVVRWGKALQLSLVV